MQPITSASTTSICAALWVTLLFLIITSCSVLNKREATTNKERYPSFLQIGHRGTRGLMPENTIPAMIKAIQVGANTIEVDVHITKDGKVVIYHDDSFNPEYTLMPDGSEITQQDRKKFTFYQMDYASIRRFIIGSKKYSAFPQRKL
jgi:glycerophosphoryl diester phosphodiesterase